MNIKYISISIVVLIALIVIMYYYLKYNDNTKINDVVKIEYKKITFDDMDKIIQEKNLTNYYILDVRTKEEYNEKRIPNSLLIPDYEIETVISKIPNKKEYIFVYCRSGNRSRTATLKMNDMGYENVYDVGGISSYKGKLETN